ncbi:Serine/arginine repetitive matrix protein 1 [Heracleum sosnowskyi]|uniref:Serine/arginine repetitive matrix protein 1 n=1 Tax=Heracleum sosnowskyi TaxID=360622 RepID=A0AAD8H050_9APIA|nr:Serine/arginine repetitive matrix protein 1 [Heracleum sosnowskyi]
MSGGFFRGTSADQDTRFSNKQAKLMKSQKFAPELENLVDITKVKMDVMKPWIANRATELLGFEDEVLINFICGLLEGKVVNGKEIQIQLTGFMEKNTGKFMKELWTLLLSAEKNVSGVPQQFLDAKEEEVKKKKAESDRETHEIQKRKEKEAREREQEKVAKMDGKVDNSVRVDYDALKTTSRQRQPMDSSTQLSADEKEANGRNGSRGRIRGTPSRSNSASFSNSRSRSDDRNRSRSISVSPNNRRSDSAERGHRSPVGRSRSPHRRDSPQRSPRGRTSQYKQRSISPSGRRSPSPIGRQRRRSQSPVRRRSRTPLRRRRSPLRYRSRSPIRRRSRSPIRRRSRSPIRRRSRSPIRRRSRSPFRRRSRSPVRRRSPMRRRSRSPIRRRSPVRRRSRSPVRRRSPLRRRSPSPIRRRRSPSPAQSLSPSPVQSRSPSPVQSQSASPVRHRSVSPIRRRSPSPRQHPRSPSSPSRMSPSLAHRKPPSRRRSATPGSQSSSPQELSPQSPIRQALDSRRRRSPEHQSPPVEPLRNRNRKQYSPVRKTTPREVTGRSPETGKGSTLDRRTQISSHRSSERGRSDRNISQRGVLSSPSGSKSPPPSRMKGPSRDRRASSPHVSPRRESVIDDIRPSPPRKSKVHTAIPVSQQGEEDLLSSEAEDPKRKSSGKKIMQSSTPDELKVSAQKVTCDVKGGGQYESATLKRMARIVEDGNNQGSDDSDYGASEKLRAQGGEKRKHKKSKRQDSDDGHSSDSQIEGRKEAKRRRKEDKKLRKEERRRRKEERRRKKDERRAEKLKLKAGGTVSPPSDFEEKHQGYISDGARAGKRDLSLIDSEEQSEQKKLEIALREKAIETLRAKKGAGH